MNKLLLKGQLVLILMVLSIMGSKAEDITCLADLRNFSSNTWVTYAPANNTLQFIGRDNSNYIFWDGTGAVAAYNLNGKNGGVGLIDPNSIYPVGTYLNGSFTCQYEPFYHDLDGGMADQYNLERGEAGPIVPLEMNVGDLVNNNGVYNYYYVEVSGTFNHTEQSFVGDDGTTIKVLNGSRMSSIPEITVINESGHGKFKGVYIWNGEACLYPIEEGYFKLDGVYIATPTFDVAEGNVEPGTVVTITGNSDKLVYTTDGTNPTLDNGTVVNGTTATVTINETTTLKAIAADNDGNVSTPKSATYTVTVIGQTTKIAQVMENTGSGTFVEWTINDDPSYKVQFVQRNDANDKVYLWDGARGIVIETSGNDDNVTHAFDGFSTGDVIKGGKLNIWMSTYDYYAPTLNSVLEPLVKGENLPVTPIEGDLNSYTEADKYTFITVHGTMVKASWGDYYYVNSMDYQIDNGSYNFGITEDVDEAAYENKEGTFTLVRNGQWALFPITADYFVPDAPAAVAVEIGAAGAATFSSTEALDFTDVTTVAAYIAKEATSGNSALEFTRVYKVPANTGLIVRNAAGEDDGAVSADVPVLAGEADNVEGNLFVAATEEIASLPSVDGEYTNYILNKKNDVLGFYKANGKKVAAGKAYLKMLTGSGAAEFIGFDGEVTAIESLTAENANNEIFDLQGRRVAKAAKGVYIVNGKKVVLK